jgi:hypothetical protein
MALSSKRRAARQDCGSQLGPSRTGSTHGRLRLRDGAALDHDDFGSNQSKIMNVIGSNSSERDAGGKPVPTFPHPALKAGDLQSRGARRAHSERVRRALREIETASAHKGPPVVNPHDHGAARHRVGHAKPGAQRQGPARGSKPILVEALSRRRPRTRGVIRGLYETLIGSLCRTVRYLKNT